MQEIDRSNLAIEILSWDDSRASLGVHMRRAVGLIFATPDARTWAGRFDELNVMLVSSQNVVRHRH
jgi:hypothetical protein